MQRIEWTDGQIKAALQRGGRHRELASEYIYKKWYIYLAGAAQKYGLAREEVEEIVNDAVWKLCRRVIKVGAGEIEHLKTYAYQIVLNEANARSKAEKEPVDHLPVSQNRQENPDITLTLQETLNELEKMGYPCKDIIMMHAEGFKAKEIGQAIDLATSTVKNKVRPCREELIKRLGGKPFIS